MLEEISGYKEQIRLTHLNLIELTQKLEAIELRYKENQSKEDEYKLIDGMPFHYFMSHKLMLHHVATRKLNSDFTAAVSKEVALVLPKDNQKIFEDQIQEEFSNVIEPKTIEMMNFGDSLTEDNKTKIIEESKLLMKLNEVYNLFEKHTFSKVKTKDHSIQVKEEIKEE